MVDDEGRVKVTDFGIARAGASSMTETGSILGTAHYLSPEQAQGGQVEAGSDLYSLGIVMYEMVTGTLPFTGDNPVAIAMQHVHEPPVPPRDLVPTVPENLENVIMRALAKDPAQRYLTAQAFLDDLKMVKDGLDVAPPPSFADQETRLMAAVGSDPLQRTQVRRPGDGVSPPASAGGAYPARKAQTQCLAVDPGVPVRAGAGRGRVRPHGHTGHGGSGDHRGPQPGGQDAEGRPGRRQAAGAVGGRGRSRGSIHQVRRRPGGQTGPGQRQEGQQGRHHQGVAVVGPEDRQGAGPGRQDSDGGGRQGGRAGPHPGPAAGGLPGQAGG